MLVNYRTWSVSVVVVVAVVVVLVQSFSVSGILLCVSVCIPPFANLQNIWVLVICYQSIL